MNSTDSEKHLAAATAVEYVKDGMNVGLGTGSTAEIFVRLLGEKVQAGLKIRCIPTSTRIGQLAESLKIQLTTFDEVASLDVDIDGADEIDVNLQMIKGGGGALLKEKIVATSDDKVIIVADSRKLVKQLGAFKLPVEVIPFGRRVVERSIQRLGGVPVLRTDPSGKPYATDQENWILDCDFGLISNPGELSSQLAEVVGIVEHGLFVNIATTVIIGNNGRTEIMERS